MKRIKEQIMLVETGDDPKLWQSRLDEYLTKVSDDL